MKIKIKKLHENAVIPKYAKEGDAGLDLTCINYTQDDYGNIVYYTGIAIEIPKGYVGLLFPRSSITNYKIQLTNSVGVIDSGYRGEIMFKYKPTQVFVKSSSSIPAYDIGDRVGQLIIIPYPQIEFEEVNELTETERGNKGFGSTGI